MFRFVVKCSVFVMEVEFCKIRMCINMSKVSNILRANIIFLGNYIT